MMKKKRQNALIASIVSLALFLSACAASAPADVSAEDPDNGIKLDEATSFINTEDPENSTASSGNEETETESDSAPDVVSLPESDIVSVDQATTDDNEEAQDNDSLPAPDAEITFTVSFTGEKPLLLNAPEPETQIAVTPCAEPYSIDADFGNIYNLEQFRPDDTMKEKLLENGFVLYHEYDADLEFFQIYESNRYKNIPNFITVDSLMHTYHLYFGYLLKNIEKDYLTSYLTQLTRQMLSTSASLYDELKGCEWEEAAKRNVAFFTVAAKLLDDNTIVYDYVEEMVSYELDHINNAESIDTSKITNVTEDYTQYIPRGYYEGSKRLEQYFKAMMWYGRAHFSQENEDMERSALLISMALSENPQAYSLWEAIYTVTSFFAGASDDTGVCEYIPLLYEIYGENVTCADLIENREAFLLFHQKTAQLTAPRINSIPGLSETAPAALGFRFMGQRFTIDASIMQKLIYDDVGENSQGNTRMLPDVLDVPAALGSDTALNILIENGAADHAGYMENMNLLRNELAKENPSLWSASLYACWLNTLRPLLTVKGEGYPMFMQNEEWQKKDLECFAGSFAELKHDTVLYSKQVLAEMGGDYYEDIDDRGYAEPEPLVYARFASLTRQTAQGLEKYGMLSDADAENLSRLEEIAGQLQTISEKELQNQLLTDEEYDFIRYYGGTIEHFWIEVAKDANASDTGFSTEEFPAAIVVDIATDADSSQVLEIATGRASAILVAVNVDGKVKLASGSVYSFYQFTWPAEDRLTDSKWRQLLGIQACETGEYIDEPGISRPDWTCSYRSFP